MLIKSFPYVVLEMGTKDLGVPDHVQTKLKEMPNNLRKAFLAHFKTLSEVERMEVELLLEAKGAKELCP